MLFNYRYVNHSIEGFQVYLDHLVKEVWCKAAGEFSVDLLHADLREIVKEIYNTEIGTTRGKVKDWLYGPIKAIYDLFKNLDVAQRQQISVWYDHNNDIEALCACDPDRPPATYDDIHAIDPELGTALKDFCMGLFTDVIHLKAVSSRIGQIDEHYRAFVTENTKDRCPYCGYSDIMGPYHEYREAYDHFLAKGTYPFNSVNFRNLAPMCHACNSTYKRDQDPITTPGGIRRKAFYSYAALPPGITVKMTLNANKAANLQPDDIDLQLAAPGREEEVQTWKDVFDIERRYKAKLCGENDSKAWLQQIVEEPSNIGVTRGQLLDQMLRLTNKYPYDGANFLKGAFLTACQDAKII